MWDWALCAGGVGAALLFGVAFGNLFLGIPFHYDELQRPVYTAAFFNLLHPFALLSGVVSLSMIVMHGATYTSLKVEEPIESRAANLGRLSALAYIITFACGGACVATLLDGHAIVGAAHSSAPSDPLLKSVEVIRGGCLHNFQSAPLLWLAPVSALLGAILNWILLGTARKGAAFVASCFVQTGTILTAGIALFPFLMPSSTHPAHGLTIWDASSSEKTLLIMLIAVLILLPIVLAYTVWVFRVLKGRITLDEIRRHTGY